MPAPSRDQLIYQRFLKLLKQGETMDEDELNLSIRKFLKKVGITSQREIEKAVHAAVDQGKLSDDDLVNVSVTLRIDHQNADLVIDGQLKLQ
jgi:ribosomal protein L1